MSKSHKSLLIINGVIAIIFGILALFVTEQTMLTLIRYFGLLFIVAGAIILLIAYNKKNKQQSPTTLTIQGIVAVFVGLALLIFTRQSIMLFFIIIGAWAIIFGIIKLYLLARMKPPRQDVYVIVLSALFSIVLGLLLFLNPYKIAGIMITVVGLLALVVGAFSVYLGIKSGQA